MAYISTEHMAQAITIHPAGYVYLATDGKILIIPYH